MNRYFPVVVDVLDRHVGTATRHELMLLCGDQPAVLIDSFSDETAARAAMVELEDALARSWDADLVANGDL